MEPTVTSTAWTGDAGRDSNLRSPHLRLVREVAPVDLDAAAVAVRAPLVALGQDVASEHLLDTPRRVAAAYAELLTRSRSP
jgi:GTP cyclohydrolase I